MYTSDESYVLYDSENRKGEGTNADFNDFIFQNYPRTGEAAKRVCDYMSRQLKQPVAKEEIGFLAIHTPAGYLAG